MTAEPRHAARRIRAVHAETEARLAKTDEHLAQRILWPGRHHGLYGLAGAGHFLLDGTRYMPGRVARNAGDVIFAFRRLRQRLAYGHRVRFDQLSVVIDEQPGLGQVDDDMHTPGADGMVRDSSHCPDPRHAKTQQGSADNAIRHGIHGHSPYGQRRPNLQPQ